MKSDKILIGDILMCCEYDSESYKYMTYLKDEVLYELDSTHFIPLRYINSRLDILKYKIKLKYDDCKDIVLDVKPYSYGLFVDQSSLKHYFIESDDMLDFKALKKTLR